MPVNTHIAEVQAALGLAPDGIAGATTWAAIHDLVCGTAAERAGAPAPSGPKTLADDRSERNIATLHSRVQPLARMLIAAAAQAGIVIKVICGTRTYPEQDALYQQGRTLPGPIVTNARGGYSNHNFGTAFDVGVFIGGTYLPESPLYAAVGKIGRSLGLTWGGDWLGIEDQPHFELHPPWADHLSESQIIAAFRRRTIAGEDIFA